MGGFGSGRHLQDHERRRLVEGSFVLDADTVFAGGPIVAGAESDRALRARSVVWSLPIDYLVRDDGDGLILSVWVWWWAESAIRTDVRLEAVPLAFGGVRHYLRCPGLAGSAGCGRRAVKLYWPTFPPLGLACRRCHGLAYRSSQTRKNRPLWMQRLLTQARTAG